PLCDLVGQIDVEPGEFVGCGIAIFHWRVGRIDRQMQRARLLDRLRKFGGRGRCERDCGGETKSDRKAGHLNSFASASTHQRVSTRAGSTTPARSVMTPYCSGRRWAAKLNILSLPWRQRSRSRSAVITSSASVPASATILPFGSTMQEPPIRPEPSSSPALATAIAQVAFM